MWAITIVFLIGFALGFAAGLRHGWNQHVDFKLAETIERATEQAQKERK